MKEEGVEEQQEKIAEKLNFVAFWKAQSSGHNSID